MSREEDGILETFQFQSVARTWFNSVQASRAVGLPPFEWEEFRTVFMDRFLPRSIRDARAREFEGLK